MSHDLRKLDFRRWGSSGPSSLMLELLLTKTYNTIWCHLVWSSWKTRHNAGSHLSQDKKLNVKSSCCFFRRDINPDVLCPSDKSEQNNWLTHDKWHLKINGIWHFYIKLHIWWWSRNYFDVILRKNYKSILNNHLSTRIYKRGIYSHPPQNYYMADDGTISQPLNKF